MVRLTVANKEELRGKWVPENETRPVRFLIGGRACNISTGELSARGSNVIHHPVYWNFDAPTAKRIGEMLGARVVWSQ